MDTAIENTTFQHLSIVHSADVSKPRSNRRSTRHLVPPQVQLSRKNVATDRISDRCFEKHMADDIRICARWSQRNRRTVYYFVPPQVQFCRANVITDCISDRIFEAFSINTGVRLRSRNFRSKALFVPPQVQLCRANVVTDCLSDRVFEKQPCEEHSPLCESNNEACEQLQMDLFDNGSATCEKHQSDEHDGGVVPPIQNYDTVDRFMPLQLLLKRANIPTDRISDREFETPRCDAGEHCGRWSFSLVRTSRAGAVGSNADAATPDDECEIPVVNPDSSDFRVDGQAVARQIVQRRRRRFIERGTHLNLASAWSSTCSSQCCSQPSIPTAEASAAPAPTFGSAKYQEALNGLVGPSFLSGPHRLPEVDFEVYDNVEIGAATVARIAPAGRAGPDPAGEPSRKNRKRRRMPNVRRVCLECRQLLKSERRLWVQFAVCAHRRPLERAAIPLPSMILHDERPWKKISDSHLAQVRRGERPRALRRLRLCMHGRRLDRCGYCGGCEHGRPYGRCAVCTPCPHGRVPRSCKICGACAHGKVRERCPVCSGCPHGMLRSACRQCSGCPHGRLRSGCVKCSGCPHQRLPWNCSLCSACPHGKLRPFCKDCNGCEHGRPRLDCPLCRGCPHGRLSRFCPSCNPCIHGRRRDHCEECSSCIHGLVRWDCKECSGCPHGRVRRFCAECNPCPHGKRKQSCKKCSACPHGNIANTCALCKSCIHGRVPRFCKVCNGCPHGRLPRFCRICKPLKNRTTGGELEGGKKW